jgi:hypothetical protein
MITNATLALIAAVAAHSPALDRSFDGHHSIGREIGPVTQALPYNY